MGLDVKKRERLGVGGEAAARGGQALLQLGGGISMQLPAPHGAGAPRTGADLTSASSEAGQQAALLQILTLAKLAAQLPVPQPQFCAPPAAAAPAAFAPLPQLGAPSAGAEASGTSSDRIALPMADATAELEAAPSVAGLKLPVSCNDIRGVVYLDQQVVACYCPQCEQRVAAGHGRPLFSFTRFERHSGSKAKKWRLSIRIDPGAVKEAPIDEPPLALGQWLESKGLVSWAPRGGLKIGPSGCAGGGMGSSDDEGSPLWGEDSSRRAGQERRLATIGPRQLAYLPNGTTGAPPASPLGKRTRQEYETPDLPSHADRQQWLAGQLASFDAVAAAAAASSGDAGSGAAAAGGAEGSSEASGAPWTAALAAKHAAIFSLIYGLLDDGEDRRSFNEVYLPWLNDHELPAQRLDLEFATLHSYLRLAGGGGMGWGTAAAAAAAAKKVDYMELPQPVRYEELQREVMMSLKPDLFEGLRFDLTKPLNHNFALSHSIFMGNIDVPTANPSQVVKMPMGTYEFGANLVSNRGNLMLGRVTSDGRLTGRVKYDVHEMAALKSQFQIASEKGMSQAMFDLDFKGKDWNGQLKYGTSNFYGANYFQSVTPRLSLGGEVFYLAEQRRSGIGLAARHAGEKHIATAQVANTGLVSLTYIQKISEKVSLASDFMWNLNSREASASFGYDYILRQCRLRGRIDTDGKIAAFLEERLNVGVNFVLSAEVDHPRKDYKFGFGLTVGE
ncbi:mitochondrial import receptor subunit TOM40-1-like [Chlorella sorokiniana]|uniref:Mitochondrial import receptor subunit TOM40-1-like n=1 Tax=Chlorella sorokiniana TaxID=3076 RepID=A0A2P6U453_CHLSO|nr:mitochondrial import receptor subunit TOM40-1-like [Chlorella sorokiniana]|eukprot:PRW61086.1 mitochondrial import receptor subunit TOM40-1-like [Chlorella sorokiniana]